MSTANEMWSSAENTSTSGREPRVDERARMPVLRRSETLGRVRQRPRVTGHLPRFTPPLGLVWCPQITSAS